MSNSEVRFRLKKPLLIYLLAICFVIAPLANVIGSMISIGIHDWYVPATTLAFLKRISWVDRSWLLLTLIAGICLFNQRKWSWLLAIVSLAVASAFNVHYSLKYSTQLAGHGHFFTVLFLLSNLAVIVILYHFRYPYIDRREAWWGIQPRYRCQFDATADDGSGKLAGRVTNISLTGAYLEIPGSPQLKEGVFVALQIPGLSTIKSEVVRVTDHGLGLRFQAAPEHKKEIQQLIAGLSELPIGDMTQVKA